jgi:hypothetical protein
VPLIVSLNQNNIYTVYLPIILRIFWFYLDRIMPFVLSFKRKTCETAVYQIAKNCFFFPGSEFICTLRSLPLSAAILKTKDMQDTLLFLLTGYWRVEWELSSYCNRHLRISHSLRLLLHPMTSSITQLYINLFAFSVLYQDHTKCREG